ncbi:MAG: hypothetical protein AAGC54_04655, partial [Cyanobacteria bacterium P01_F01_bin.4]
MKFNPDKHHRRSIRLHGYDYASPGAYFVTLCAYQRQCIFGEIVDGQMRLNEFGQIVESEWQKSAQIRHEIELADYVVMPNHFHAIVWLLPPTEPPVGARGSSPSATHNTQPTTSRSHPNQIKTSDMSDMRKPYRADILGWARGSSPLRVDDNDEILP